MTPEYIADSLTFGLYGVPVGVVLGYALAKVEAHYRRNHSHRRPR